MTYSILCVEDDMQVAQVLNRNLGALCDSFDHVVNAESGYLAVKAKNYDLILLDLNLPDISGTQFCKVLRDNNNQVPVIVLTGTTAEHALVTSLDSGADDYIRKPFRVDELKARINAVMRRQSLPKNTTISIVAGDLVINSRERKVSRNEQVIALTSKEFDLLEYMVKHEGQVFSRSQLLDAVWGFAYGGYDHTVNSHVNRLRAKIERNPDKPEYITTVWGVGYKFISIARLDS